MGVQICTHYLLNQEDFSWGMLTNKLIFWGGFSSEVHCTITADCTIITTSIIISLLIPSSVHCLSWKCCRYSLGSILPHLLKCWLCPHLNKISSTPIMEAQLSSQQQARTRMTSIKTTQSRPNQLKPSYKKSSARVSSVPNPIHIFFCLMSSPKSTQKYNNTSSQQ